MTPGFAPKGGLVGGWQGPPLGPNRSDRRRGIASDASSIIITRMRTTLDLDPNVLRELKRRQRREGKSLGQLASELLTVALAEEPKSPPPFRWISQDMGALVDLEDKELIQRILDES